MATITVAAVSFTVTNDLDHNLQTMLDRIDEVADKGARLVQFAEFCNHPTWYRDQDHCYQSALPQPNNGFLESIQAKAREREIMVCFNATVQGEYPTVYDQNHLIGTDGRLIGTTRKQVLMYIEKDFYTPSPDEAQVYDTEFGRIGMLSCMDGLVPETARVLALKGAQIILNSLASNALDEAHTHIPVRAAENRVWVIAANRSGPIVDESEMATLEQVSGIPYDLLLAGGESQVVAPDGTPLVRGEPRVDGIVYAEIDPAVALDKALAGGGDVVRDRRPEAYGILSQPIAQLPVIREGRSEPARELRVAAIQAGAGTGSPASNMDSILQSAKRAIRNTEAQVIVLPELFPFTRARILNDRKLAAKDSKQALEMLVETARETGRWVATSLVEEAEGRAYNTAWLIGPDGIAGSYRQVHVHPEDRGWASPGREFQVVETPFGSVGLMTGYDGLFPESARVLAKLGADLILYPTTFREQYEVDLGVIERCSENHVSLVVAARPDSPVGGTSAVLALPHEYTFPITGEVNVPDRFDAAPGEGQVVTGVVDLTLSRDKLLMGRTDLIRDSRPDLYGVLTAEPVSVRR
jgi:predicted amidohydrolase